MSFPHLIAENSAPFSNAESKSLPEPSTPTKNNVHWRMYISVAGKIIIILLFIVTVAVNGQSILEKWTAPATADSLMNPLSGDPSAAESGKKIFMKACWTCHGTEGHGDGPASVDMTIKPARLNSLAVQQQTDGALFWKISNGRGEMAAFKESLSGKQRWQLVNFIRGLKDLNTGKNETAP